MHTSKCSLLYQQQLRHSEAVCRQDIRKLEEQLEEYEQVQESYAALQEALSSAVDEANRESCLHDRALQSCEGELSNAELAILSCENEVCLIFLFPCFCL